MDALRRVLVHCFEQQNVHLFSGDTGEHCISALGVDSSNWILIAFLPCSSAGVQVLRHADANCHLRLDSFSIDYWRSGILFSIHRAAWPGLLCLWFDFQVFYAFFNAFYCRLCVQSQDQRWGRSEFGNRAGAAQSLAPFPQDGLRPYCIIVLVRVTRTMRVV